MANTKVRFTFKALTIACSEVERSVRFYETVLGATRMPTDNGVGWWYQLGSFVFTLMPNADESSPASFPTHAMAILWLEVDDLEAAHNRFIKSDVRIIQPPDGLFMMVADPDGLVIEVWQAEPEPVLE